MSVYVDYTKTNAGLFWGFSGLQLATLGLTAIPGFLAAGASRWLFVFVIWLPTWVVLVLLVRVPVGGRTAVGWLVGLVAHTAGTAAGWTRWQSRVAAGTATNDREVDLPGVLAGIEIHDGPPWGPQLSRVAIVQDRARRTWAVTAGLVHQGLGFADAATRDQMGAGLSSLAEVAMRTELVDLISVTVRTQPEDGQARREWVRVNHRPGAPPVAVAVTTDLEARLEAAGVRTETFLTVVVTEAAIARLVCRTGAGLEGRARVLHGVMAELETQLLGAVGCRSVTWLDSPALSKAVRTGFAPGDAAALSAAELAALRAPDVKAEQPLAAAGPGVAFAAARHYSHDAWNSVSDTIMLPDRGARMGALAPVLTPAVVGERRALTVFYPVVSGRTADRRTESQEMAASSARALRTKLGQSTRARQARQENQIDQRDQRLATGSALVLPCAVATVTVPGNWPIQEAGRRLDASIRGAGFTPLRLDLAQDSGFAAGVIPLGVGAPSHRGRGRG